MAHKDLREFTKALQSGSDLITIDDEVDWDQELAGIGRLSCERDGPAFMFNNVKDYAGWRAGRVPPRSAASRSPDWQEPASPHNP
ncbi:MAG: hypothetical protein HOB86_13030 [Rhodospirillaceae bacterium]|nr:hypothetical protein [Rhodospirillaceae bacterium]